MKIVSVLRTGEEYKAKYAKFLHSQLKGFDSVCLTDLPSITGIKTLPLSDKSWVGWWAKMELFNPDGPLGGEDLFYMDVDTLIVGDIRPILRKVKDTTQMVMLSDFFHPNYAASGVMYIPANVKHKVWNLWHEYMDWFMVRARRPGRIGDQGVIAQAIPQAKRWDKLLPGKIVSYKKHVVGPGGVGYDPLRSEGNGTVPAGAAIVCYHGEPRPWTVGR